MNRTRLIFFVAIAVALVIVAIGLVARSASPANNPIAPAQSSEPIEVRVVTALPIEPSEPDGGALGHEHFHCRGKYTTDRDVAGERTKIPGSERAENGVGFGLDGDHRASRAGEDRRARQGERPQAQAADPIEPANRARGRRHW